jgi:hypothetical protein
MSMYVVSVSDVLCNSKKKEKTIRPPRRCREGCWDLAQE